MIRYLCFLSCILISSASFGWWIFGDDDGMPRLSELMEPASLLIDEASDLASEGKVTESVEKYRAALRELEAIERKYPDKLDKPEFSTLKTKRAYVSAAIDAILLSQARKNAKVVATSNTEDLEKRLVAERRTRVLNAIAQKKFKTANDILAEWLAREPKSALALNLKAAACTAQGRFREAESTLDEAISVNPRDYVAYYNMARFYIQTKNNLSGALRYYETGRSFGGPKDEELEKMFK